jgi:hypothetical protein
MPAPYTVRTFPWACPSPGYLRASGTSLSAHRLSMNGVVFPSGDPCGSRISAPARSERPGLQRGPSREVQLSGARSRRQRAGSRQRPRGTTRLGATGACDERARAAEVEAASASGPDDGRSAEGLIVSEPRSSFQFGRCMSASSRSPFAMARQSIGMKVVANPHVGDERDYGPGGEVERLVLDFLADRARGSS